MIECRSIDSREEKFAPSAAAAREESSELSLVNFNVAVREAANATGANKTSSRLSRVSWIEVECAGWSSHMPETSAHGRLAEKAIFRRTFRLCDVREDGERNVCTNRAINYDIVSRGIKFRFSARRKEPTARRNFAADLFANGLR